MKNLRYEDITAIIDTRESRPLSLSPLKIERACLETADYSIKGHEDKVALELKELPDFIACCTFERDRFERELVRMRDFKHKAIVIKATWSEIEQESYRSKTKNLAVFGSAAAFAMDANVSIIMAENHKIADIYVTRFLWIAANRIHRSDAK